MGTKSRFAAGVLSLTLVFSGVGVPLFVGARVVRADGTSTAAQLEASARQATSDFNTGPTSSGGISGAMDAVQNGGSISTNNSSQSALSWLWGKAVSAWNAVASWWSSLFNSPNSTPAEKALALQKMQEAAAQRAALGNNPGPGGGSGTGGDTSGGCG